MATAVSGLPTTSLPLVWLCQDPRAEKIAGLGNLCKPITDALNSIDLILASICPGNKGYIPVHL
jgi:hypothetical protein